MVTVEKINFISNQEEVDKTIENILNSQAKQNKLKKVL